VSKRRRRTVKAQIPTARQGARSAVDRVTAMTTQPAPTANVGTSVPMRPDPAWSVVPFAPSLPIPPSAINRPRPDTGRPEPRLYEVEVGWNLPGSSHRQLPWFMLRQAADRISLFRRCIQIRKEHMQGLDWGFRVSPGAVEAATRTSGGTSRAKLERELHANLGDEIQRAKDFWQVPDRGQDYEFSEWLGLLLEETYVLDALAIYPRLTYGGGLDSLEILDGTTIKPLRDERGGRPRPPLPAFQQNLYGFPRGEFQATVDEAGLVPGGLAADDLIYKRRTIRNWTPYGYSPVEQALDDGDLYLKRMRWMKAEYTHGAMPQGTFEVAEGSSLNPQQVAELERFYNDLLAGNTEERMKARFLPPGITPSERGDIGEKYRPEYDLHLLKLVISHFDTVLPELGFSEAKGLGSSGYHEGQEDVQQRKTLPIIKDVQGLVTRISHRYLDIPREIEFFFLGLDDEDEAAADELESNRFKEGVITLNDRRDRLGLERLPFAEADMPMIVLTRGILFLEGASQGVPPGAAIEPGKALQEGGASPPMDEQVEQDEDPDGTDTAPAAKPGEDPKAAEKKAYARWVRKGRTRAFEWHHHTDDEVAVLTKAGGADPKADARNWPGWAKDQKAAKHWAKVLPAAMTGAVQTRALAERWLASRSGATSVTDARVWLDGQGVDVTDALAAVFDGLYADGYIIGHAAAGAVSAGAEIDWGGWTPGDTEAAYEVLGVDGGVGLDQLLSGAGVTIKSIGANRLDDLANRLAEALANGDSVDTLAKSLTDVLADPQWAYFVAQTEITRAVSAATQNVYRRNGIESNEWATAADQRVCPVCDGNAADGPVRVGVAFDSGDTAPPAHPACRCALMPVIVSPDDLL